MIVSTELAFAFMLARIVYLDVLGRSLTLSDALVIVAIIAFNCCLTAFKIKQTNLQTLCDEINKLKDSQNQISQKLNAFEELHQEISKQSEEVKKMISTHNISTAFTQKRHML